MFTTEEKKWFIQAAGAPAESTIQEDDDGNIVVIEPSGKTHKIFPVCAECGDSTGTCECVAT